MGGKCRPPPAVRHTYKRLTGGLTYRDVALRYGEEAAERITERARKEVERKAREQSDT